MADRKHIITLGGMPGSGKSTVRNILAEKLGYSTFSTGDFTRKLAGERDMTLEEFNEQIAGDKSIDLLIDAELERIAAEEDEMIVDSHLAYHFIPNAFKVYLDISLDEAAKRILGDQSEIRKASGDTMATLEEAKERTAKRIDNHKDRYMRHYGINPYDPSQFDCVINTEQYQPERIASMIAGEFQKWRGEN